MIASSTKVYLVVACTLVLSVHLASAVDNCNQTAAERVRCKAQGNRTKCLEKGCHYCRNAKPACIEGIVCKTTPTAADDCRTSTTETITPLQCLARNCSWCKSQPVYKCVKDSSAPTTPPPPGTPVDNCNQTAAERVRCKAQGNRTKCLEKGCHYCRNAKPACIEGKVCKTTPTAADDCRTSTTETITPLQCLARNCSWCKSQPVYKCVKDSSSPTPPPPPSAPVDNCNQTAAERTRCKAQGNRTKCLEKGCHYCRNAKPACIEGKVCKTTPTAAHDCRTSSTEVITPKQCLERNCSWCKSNADIKCVKDVPANGSSACQASNPLRCYPFPDHNITEAECNAGTGCIFCSSATDVTKRCVRDGCPQGWLKRFDNESCCDPSGPRIVGGVASEKGKWPWMAALLSDGAFICGATLITSTRALSAAHCDDTNLEVLLGTNDLQDAAAVRRAATSILHPNYGTLKEEDNDIMLLVLASAVTLVPGSIEAIKLPDGETPPDGMRCYTIGWGRTVDDPNQNTERFLRDVDVKIQPFATTCEVALTSLTEITLDVASKVCAGILAGGKDSCQGDSGGPLACQRCRNCDWYIAGVVSIGEGCALANTPAIYTRVSFFQAWIQANGVAASGETHNCNLY